MHRIKNVFLDFSNLLIINILDIRTTWIFQMIFGIFTPVGLMFFLKFYVDINNMEYVIKILSGNVIISMTMPIMLLLSSRIAILKRDGSIDYYRTLPVNMNVFVVSLLISSLIAYTPAIIMVFVLGGVLLGIKISGIFSVLNITLVIVLTATSLIGIATFIGWKTSKPEQANAVGNILFTIMIVMSPVLIPDDKIPRILNIASHFSPATYASKLIKMILTNAYNYQYYKYLIIMFIFVAISCIILKKAWE